MIPALALALLLVSAAPAAAGPEPGARGERFGTSHGGRPLVVVHQGDPDAARTVLVVGEVHGNEDAGRAVVTRLRFAPPPAGVRLLTVMTANPDGHRAGTRQNGRGVDLNRNFRSRWRKAGRPWSTYYSGPRVESERETRAVAALVRRERPDVTIWYHQHMDLVVDPGGSARAAARRYARAVDMSLEPVGPYRGTATGWQNRTFTDASAFVVELPAGPLRGASVREHTGAVFASVG